VVTEVAVAEVEEVKASAAADAEVAAAGAVVTAVAVEAGVVVAECCWRLWSFSSSPSW
jgi:hypothetical protein